MNERRSLHLATKRYMTIYGMSRRQAEVFTLHRRHDSISSIASRLGISDSTVMSHLYLARMKRSGGK